MKKSLQDLRNLIQLAAEDLYAAITFNSDYSIVSDFLADWSHGNLITALETISVSAIDRIQVSVTSDYHYSTDMDGHTETDIDLSLSLFRQLQHLLEAGQVRPAYLSHLDPRLLDFRAPDYGCPKGLEPEEQDDLFGPF